MKKREVFEVAFLVALYQFVNYGLAEFAYMQVPTRLFIAALVTPFVLELSIVMAESVLSFLKKSIRELLEDVIDDD